jgi:hypothetical protein
MSQISGGFYLGSWFVPQFNIPKQQSWLLPLAYDGNGSLISTQNVEELKVNPEDMDELPQDIQDGFAQWITFSPPIVDLFYVQGIIHGEFYIQSIPVSSFYLT